MSHDTTEPPPERAQTLAYQPSARRGLVTIEPNSENRSVAIHIRRTQDRPWPLALGFGGLAGVAALAALIMVFHSADASARAFILGGFSAICALLAAACIAAPNELPPIELRADAHGLQMRSGAQGETLAWSANEIDDISAESEHSPETASDRTAVLITFADGEYVAIPLPSRDDRDAVVRVRRDALKLKSNDLSP